MVFQQFAFKSFGYLNFGAGQAELLRRPETAGFIKILLVEAGGKVVVDFQEYQLEQAALFFINAGQYYALDEACAGTALCYNRDFYCVEIHDQEVACDGILFHNAYELPVVRVPADARPALTRLLHGIEQELARPDAHQEEMIRLQLKQLIIAATRLWKQQHGVASEQARQEVEFARTFSQLVEWHYHRHHAVADYAALLHLTPKALQKRLARAGHPGPNDVIKNRIILEAKRLLAHTQLLVKEIGYKLGYDDTSYFSRLFTQQTGTTPHLFRQRYQQEAAPAGEIVLAMSPIVP